MRDCVNDFFWKVIFFFENLKFFFLTPKPIYEVKSLEISRRKFLITCLSDSKNVTKIYIDNS
jgi:hypothetical protein